MKFLDLFAGIGGFRLGMEQAGHKCVGFVEWDKYARKSYEAIHDTEGEWTAQVFQMTIFDDLGIEDKSMQSVEDSHAKLFQLLGSEKDSLTLEELYSLKSLVSPVSSDHDIYSLRTSKDCLTMTGEIRSRLSSEHWMNSGMMRNGKCLTLKILESHKTGKGCSLLDILEEQVDEKYFLSEELTKRLVLA